MNLDPCTDPFGYLHREWMRKAFLYKDNAAVYRRLAATALELRGNKK